MGDEECWDEYDRLRAKAILRGINTDNMTLAELRRLVGDDE